MAKKIVVIPGDGIGPEIVTEAKKILDKVGSVYGHNMKYTDILVINEIEIIHYIYMIYPLTFLFSALFSLLVAFLVNLILTAKVKGVKAVEALKSVE